jgi:23S rRNA (uracil1939-C5)-methyltransferase
MGKKRLHKEEIVKIKQVVHGGQGLGEAENGKKIFVWGALPGETVKVQVVKNKKDWAEGFVVEIIEASPDRIEPEEPNIYIATSPWQILNYQKEANNKQGILDETFEREGLSIAWQDFYQTKAPYGYRNKMEYNFWYFTETKQVSLALHQRGSHQKIAVKGSMLATEAINEAGQALINYINDQGIESRPLKSVILRSDQSGKVGICLFVNDPGVASAFSGFEYPNSIFEIIYSNPKSPASVTTEVLKESNETLVDSLLGKRFKYSTRSFFQVNIPVYEKVLEIIAREIKLTSIKKVVDLYSGVGSIGLSVIGDNHDLTMVETSQESTDQAKINMLGRKNCHVVTTTAETALEYITGNEVIVVDPPRVGLHKKVTEKLLDAKPPKIIYLSCNPATQARDIKALVNGGYEVISAQGFNFFPRTPHIESLVVLKKHNN